MDIIRQEPNFTEFRDKRTEYKCRIIRPRHLWHLCGYVEIPKTHRFFGKDLTSGNDGIYNISVHGGVTYSDNMGIEGTWWIGFDCGHGWDVNPMNMMFDDIAGTRMFERELKSSTYKTVDYVEKECIELAYQLWLIP